MPGIQSSRDKEKMTSYIMGIDIGTTSVKVCLINSITREVIHKNVKVNRVSVCHSVDFVDIFYVLCYECPHLSYSAAIMFHIMIRSDRTR